jgi:putative ABC transport system substrate-binding protein
MGRGFWLLFCAAFLVLIVMPGVPVQAHDRPVHVGVVLFGDSRKPQVRGLKDGLAELGLRQGDNLTVTELNAKNDRAKLPGFVDDLRGRGVDLMVAAGGLEADAMRKALGPDSPIPVVVLYVNSIVERKLVASRRSAGWPVTGVDNLNAEISGKRVGLIKTLLPDVRRILILYYERIPPSRIGVAEARKAAAKLGVRIDARAVASREEIRAVMEGLEPGEVDAMLTVPTAPIDNTLKDIILPNVDRLNLPLMTHSRPMAEAGALASYGAPFYDLGRQGARLADKVLHGMAPERIPFEIPKKFVYSVNRSVMARLGIRSSELARSQINEYVGE